MVSAIGTVQGHKFDCKWEISVNVTESERRDLNSLFLNVYTSKTHISTTLNIIEMKC